MGVVTFLGCFLRHIYEPYLKSRFERLFCIDGQLICLRGFVIPRFLRDLRIMNWSQPTQTSLFSIETIDKFDETTTMTTQKITNKDHSGLDLRGDAKKKIISKAIQ